MKPKMLRFKIRNPEGPEQNPWLYQRIFFNFGASTTAVSTSAATASTGSVGLSLVDGDITAVQAVTVHSFDRVPHQLLVAEGNESEASLLEEEEI